MFVARVIKKFEYTQTNETNFITHWIKCHHIGNHTIFVYRKYLENKQTIYKIYPHHRQTVDLLLTHVFVPILCIAVPTVLTVNAQEEANQLRFRSLLPQSKPAPCSRIRVCTYGGVVRSSNIKRNPEAGRGCAAASPPTIAASAL